MRARVFFICLGLLFATSCVDGNTAFQILGHFSLDTSCDLESAAVEFPSWDLSYDGVDADYIFNVLLSSQLVDRVHELEAPNKNDIRVDGWEVELRDVSGALLPLAGVINPYTTGQGSGFVVPAGSAGTGGKLRLIPRDYRAALQAITLGAAPAATDTFPIKIRFYVFGETFGGQEIETPWFEYTITLCAGCYEIDCTVEDDPEECQPGQDEAEYCAATS